MRVDPTEEGRRWLTQARNDLGWTRLLAEQGAHHMACFHAQQVTEMALKAFLYAQGEEIVLGHSVQRLAQAVAEHDRDLGAQAQRWVHLDGYYIPTRYPNGLPDGIPSEVYTEQASTGAVALATEAVEAIAERITEEG